MKLLISDETKFKKLTQNPTKSIEDSLISYLRKLKKDKIIDDAILHKILPCGPTPGVLYGLPKVHKLFALFARLFLQLTLTTTIWHHILCAYFNPSPRMNS